MNNEIGELFPKKKMKENIYIDNNLINSFEDCTFRNNTFQSNFNKTKGRLNDKIEFINHNKSNTNKSAKRIVEIDNSKRLIAIKKCFQIVNNRKDLNKYLKEKCQKILNEKKKDANNENETIGKQILSNTCNSFFKRNVDNFINNYLKNNFYINENINILNNTEKNDNYQKKNITVNKNCSLYNLTKNDNNRKEIRIINNDNKKLKEKNDIILNNNKETEKIKMKKLNSKKYINVNRMETLRMKHNNYISKIKGMFNNKKQELIKNNSFCQRYTVQNEILNSVINRLFFRDYSNNIINKDSLGKSFNKKTNPKNNNTKNNISLRKRNYQNNNNDNYINLRFENNNHNFNSMNNEQKLSCREFNKKELSYKLIKNSDIFKKDDYHQIEDINKLNLNNTMISPTLYNSQSGPHFNSPSYIPIKKIYINSPDNEDLSFICNSLKEKINRIDKNENNYQTLNLENNNKEEIIKTNYIYNNTNTNTLNDKIKNKIEKQPNSKEKKQNFKLKVMNEKSKNFNIHKSPIVNSSFNYFSQMSNRNGYASYMINHSNIRENNTNININLESAERKKQKKVKENFFDKLNLNIKCNKVDNNKHTQNQKKKLCKNENKSHSNILYNVDNNKSKKISNKNDIAENKIDKVDKEKKKKQKIKIKPKQNHQNDINKINCFHNKTSYNFFSNPNVTNYDILKKDPKLLREKHFSDLDNSFFEKTQKLDKNSDKNKVKTNQTNNNINETTNNNKIKLKKKINDIKNTTQSNNKPFSICSARLSDYNSINNKINDKNEKMNENITKMKSFINNIDKIINFCGNNKDYSNSSIRNKYYETCNTINKNYKNKNTKKNEKHKLKNVIKEFEGLKNIYINISKIKIKQTIKNSFIQKFYFYAVKKEILTNCFITKTKKYLDKKNNKNIIFSNTKKNESKKINIEEINGGIMPSTVNEFYNKNNSETKKKEINEEFISIYNSNTSNNKDNCNYQKNLIQKCSSHLRINKNNLKNQIYANPTSIIECKDLNNDINKLDQKNQENSLLNCCDEESEVTFGRKEEILLNHKSISNKKTKISNYCDINIDENINFINNNTFCYNTNNEFENYNDINNNFMFDEESFVNGEVNYFNNTFNPNKLINNKVIYDFEINSITNNYYNSNNIILFNPQKNKLYIKYIEKGTIILSNIFSNHKINIYKYLKNYSFLQKNKNKSESVIYTKKKLKDNGAKNFETTTVSSKKQTFFSEINNINNHIKHNNIKEKISFEKKKNNIIKKLRIRTRSSDYIIFDKNDKSFIKKVEIDLNSINNKKVEYTLNSNYNTPKNEEKKNITSPHFIDNKKINEQIAKELDNLNINKDIKKKEKKYVEKNIVKKNLKNFHCTPKFCQLKPRTIEDIKLNDDFNENQKIFTIEEIFYIGSSISSCFKENLLSNDFISHCEEMLKYAEIEYKNRADNNNIIETYILFNEKQNKNKYEIISLLNKITNSNFKIILDKLNYLIINDNNNQYIFVKIIINKIIKEKKYINLYAKLCFELYHEIINKANNKKNNKDPYNQNLGFDNDLKNILINECKLKFNVLMNEIKDFEMKSNIKDVKKKLFYFFEYIIELIHLKMIFFDNAINYLEKLYKEYINNNNGNNNSILYLELILYLIDKILRKILCTSTIKNKNSFKKLIEDKIVVIFENSELLRNYLKYKIINIKEKINNFLDNNMTKLIPIENELEFNSIYINEIINNIFINNKKEDNIKLLLLNDLDSFIKDKILNNSSNITEHNWFIIDEIIFNIHISLDDFISYYIEITKSIDIKNKTYQYEYFEFVLNYYIQYILEDKENLKKRILDIFLKFCSKDDNNEKDYENLGHIVFLLLNKNIFKINDIDNFTNENIKIKENITEIIKNAILFDKEQYKLFQQTNFFINNNELFSNLENIL